ncbi:SPOR domain-containing protein [Draconibacterium sp. IB214405]|uniref:SPOR domain-containing protein n=1 Tax=Draconibacterium sp. IB214405 TaxID=3097352 RepID=UPI002A0BB6F8|nr:SPOR domain-containing protein [Draconibacterium sp. IB214405]MDX8341070.1 SPOR domain-containing protein [Draconibacterium sp. IB214405]
MIFRKVLALLTIFFIFLFASNKVFGGNQENPLSEAIRLFDNGQYEDAEVILKKLLDEKPDHLMVNYYYGACRTENGHYGTNEIIYLLNGSLGESPLKTDYYIAVQYHAKNRWSEALNYYKLFGDKADEETKQEVKLAEKMQQCRDKINPFEAAEETTATTETATSDVLPTPVPRETEPEPFNPVIGETMASIEMNDSVDYEATIDSIPADSALIDSMEAEPVIEEPSPRVIKEPINFVVNAEITYPDTTFFKTKKGLKFYNEGSSKQKELDKTTVETDELRKKYGATSSYSEKQSLGKVILEKETGIYQLRDESAALLIKAQQEEDAFWQKATPDEKQTFREEFAAYNSALHEMTAPEEPDSIIFISPSIAPASGIITNETNGANEDELIYKIQLGAYSRGLPSYVKRLFDKLSYIRKIENYTDDKGIVVYTTGNLSNYDDALKMQEQVRQEGVDDAFVVPYFNGKRITLKEAKEIENDK